MTFLNILLRLKFVDWTKIKHGKVRRHLSNQMLIKRFYKTLIVA